MRRAFTLIELLVVIAIIAIVMTFSLGAIYVSQESARAEKTRGLIAKIDQIIMEKYESYRYRRVPIRMGYDKTGNPISETPAAFAKRRLQAVRELMRMELPDRWTDISDAPQIIPSTAVPAVTRAYRRHNTGVTEQYQGAECLYLILALSGDDRAAIICERNSGDRDNNGAGDGAPEILDGWGNPISFLRWPAGFLNSAANGYLTDIQDNTSVSTDDHDPFDHRKVHTEAYVMYPLIYSAGPDRFTDIRSDDSFCEEMTSVSSPLKYSTASGGWNNNPLNSTAGSIGAPYDWGSDGLNHRDNIHNHLLGVK